MKRLAIIILALFLSLSSYAQVFPGAVATDADLLVAANRASTSLTSAATSTQTTLYVQNTASFGATGVLTIQDERIKYTSKTAGVFSGCTRGYDGSTAAAHSAGLLVSGNVVAAYHNVLAAEIKAIESRIISSPINVLEYGATTSLIQDAVDATPDGGTLRFPDGDYSFGTITISKAIHINLGSGTYTATANPLFSLGTTKHVVITGQGKENTILVAYNGTGYVIDINGTATNDSLYLSDFSVTGNSVASGGIRINRERGGYSVERIWVYGFTNTGAEALLLGGCNQGTFIDVDLSDSTIGLHLTKWDRPGGGHSTANLNMFIRGQIVANGTAILSDGDSNQANSFYGVNFLANTSAPALNLITAWGWIIEGCYFEANAAGTSLIELGDGTYYASRNSIRNNWFAESNAITSLIHVVRGFGNRIEENSLGCTSSVTNLITLETQVQETWLVHNDGNYPSTTLVDNSGAQDTVVISNANSQIFGSPVTFTRTGYIGLNQSNPQASIHSTRADTFRQMILERSYTASDNTKPLATLNMTAATNSSPLQINMTASGGSHSSYPFTSGIEIDNRTNNHDGINIRNNTTPIFSLTYDGIAKFSANPVFSGTSTPASNAACTAGTMTWDASYIYICTASGAWKRATLTGGY